MGGSRTVKRLGAVVAAGLVAAGCGDSRSASGPTLRVAAAPVLAPVLERCTPRIAGVRVRLQVADSAKIGAEIRRGVLPDVFVAANTGLPRALAREGRVETPVAFATNELVIAVPAGDRRIRGLDDLARGGRAIAMGTVSSPLGAYTRYVLARLPTYERIQVLSRVRAQAADAAGVLEHVEAQDVQAGFAFRSDVAAVGDALRPVRLPGDLEPTVAYGAAAVKGAPQPQAARRVVADLLRGGCARALRDGGFGPPPR